MSLSDFAGAVSAALYRQIGRANGRMQRHRPLAVDVLEDETSYLVVFDAPGAGPDDVQVRYLEGTVKVQLDRFRQFHDGYEMRFPGRGMELEGEAELPGDALVEPDAGMATLTESGALQIEIPKRSAVDDVDIEDTTESGTDGIAIDD
ncbi:Hsp20/alpha crystallin family protein [Natronococcus occultus]|uniref:Molecular chaperone (Small heat shock protein) n=1 Tax=Natronococcus occultus SP4 TaxID=694430 RepID=L0JUT1_9EURY|nr:Hsp20 family protein [Natronococcus occultus]AGB36521.1 molecular chaperone (small heat shock protein) [Natronococcus occultus SP4]